jgi:hypothetical protein
MIIISIRQWNKVIFAGERIFNIFGSDGHCTTLEEKEKKIKN